MSAAEPAAVARKGGTAIAAALVAAVTLIFQLPFFDRWINFMDEGHLLQYADIIASGGDLYGDVTVYPLPGAFYFLAGLFQIFEPSILLSRWIVTIQFTLFVTLCFVLVRRLVPLGYALGLVAVLLTYRIWAFPHWHMYSYSTSALLVFLVCMLVLLRFFETGRQAWLIAAGVTYGVGVTFKQDYGAAALVGFVIPLVLYARSSTNRDEGTAAVLTGFLGPAAIVGLSVGGYFAWQGLLDDLLRFTVFNHFAGMASYEYMSFPSLWPLFAQNPALRTDSGIASHLPAIVVTLDWQTVNESYLYNKTAVVDLAVRLFYFGPYLLLACGGWRLVRRRQELDDARGRDAYMRELTIYSFALGLMVLISLNRPQDYVHMAVLYWPIFCLVTIYARALRVALPHAALALFLVALVPATAVGGYTVSLVRRMVNIHDTYFDHPRAHIYTTAKQAETIGGLISYIEENTEPDERVAVMPYSPVFNFLADRDGPHRTSYILWPFPEIDDRDRQIVEAMERHGTDMLVFDFVYFHDFPRVRDYAPELFAYLVQNFEMDEVFTSDETWPKKLAVARRKPEPTEGKRIDLAVEGVDVFIDSPDRPPFPVPPTERQSYVALDLWPFRPVMSIRPSADGRETVVAVPVHVPPMARLETSVGIKPVLWDKLPPSWVRFTLSVRRGEDRDILFTKTLDTTNVVEDRAWFPVHVPLHEFAGQTITLEFAVACQRERAETLFMGGWGMPRVVVPDAGKS